MIRVLHFTWNPLLGDISSEERFLLVEEMRDFAVSIKNSGMVEPMSLFNPIPTWLYWEGLTEGQCERLADVVSAYASDIEKGGMIGLPCVTFEVPE